MTRRALATGTGGGGMPVALARRRLVAAPDPEAVLATVQALADGGDAALFDALLSQTTVVHDEHHQTLDDPFLLAPSSSPLRELALRGLVALAPPESGRGEALRSQLRTLSLSGTAQALSPTSLRHLDRLGGLRALWLKLTAPSAGASLASHPGLSSVSLVSCYLSPEEIRSWAGTSIGHLLVAGVHPLGPAMTHLPGLDLLRDLRALHLLHLPALRAVPDLSVHDALTAVSLQGLAALTGVPLLPAGLTTLSLSGLPWGRKAMAAALGELGALSHLSVEGIPLADLTWLPEAPIQSLAVRDSAALTDLRALAARPSLCRHLRSLDLSGCAALVDLGPLAALKNLVQLELRGCSQVTDVRPLLALPSLRRLDLAGSGVQAPLPLALRRPAARRCRDPQSQPQPQPSSRTRPLGPRLEAQQQAALQRLRQLLHSGDTAQVEQAVELARALADPQVYARLLQGTRLACEEGERLPSLQGNGYFVGQRGDRARLRWALLQMLADAPSSLSDLSALRAGTSSLLVDVPVLDAALLAAFPGLRCLELRQVKALHHPEALERLGGLASLTLSMCALPDGVRLPPTLAALDIEHLPHADLALLSPCRGLTALSITGAPQLSTLSGLEGVRGLGALRLARVDALADLSALSALPALEWLSVRGAPALTSLAGLANHRHLRGIEIIGARQLREVQDLRGCVSLEGVVLHDCGALASLAGLQDATALRRLEVSDCEHLLDLAPLQDASLLEVSLRRCGGLRSLAGLAGSRELTALHLERLRTLPDLRGLEGLTALTTLSILHASALVSLSALAGLPRLQHLSLYNCAALSDLSALAMLPALTDLTLAHIPRWLDLGPLAGLPDGVTLRLEGVSELASLHRLPPGATVILSQKSLEPSAVPPSLLPQVRWLP